MKGKWRWYTEELRALSTIKEKIEKMVSNKDKKEKDVFEVKLHGNP